MKVTMRLSLILILLNIPALAFSQEIYEHGHGAMQVFDTKGMANSPAWVIAWVFFMMASFISSAIFMKNHAEARWVGGCFLLGMIALTIATEGFGMPSLSGFIATIHLLAWTPALIILIKRKPFKGEVSAFSIWSGVMTFVILFSFVFDIRDSAIFLSSYF